LKILHVITTIERGGAEKQLLILSREQRNRGYEVTVVYLKGNPELELEFLDSGVTIDNDLEGKNPLKQLLLLWKLTRDKKQIVHAHLPRAELLSAVVKPRGVFLVTRHNAEPFFPGAPRLISILCSRFVSHMSKYVIAISKAVSDYLYKSGEIPKSRRIPIVHYGFPADNQAQFSPKRSNRIGTVSRLVPQKDLVTLLDAFSIVLKEFSNLSLTIVGEGPDRDNLEIYTHQLKINDVVFLPGRTHDVDNFMKSLDLFILTSKYEGFGMVLLEAMSNQTPIIVSESLAALEVLGDEYPLTFPIGDAKILAQCIIKSLNSNLEQYVQYGNSRLKRFSPSVMEQKIHMLYNV
jgi:glycosyltransferase involved in cell wall biosynthesis